MSMMDIMQANVSNWKIASAPIGCTCCRNNLKVLATQNSTGLFLTDVMCLCIGSPLNNCHPQANEVAISWNSTSHWGRGTVAVKHLVTLKVSTQRWHVASTHISLAKAVHVATLNFQATKKCHPVLFPSEEEGTFVNNYNYYGLVRRDFWEVKAEWCGTSGTKSGPAFQAMESPKLGRSLVCWKNSNKASGLRGGIRRLRCIIALYFCALILYSPQGN